MNPSTDRGRRRALDDLLRMQERGGYTLPAEVLAAAEAAEAAGSLVVEQAARLHPADVATKLVDQLVQGVEIDLLAAAGELVEDRRHAERADLAQQLAQLVAEQASTRAVSVATRLANEIISEHLQPAYRDLLDAARGPAEQLAGVPIGEAAGWNAPASARKGRTALADLAERADLLRHAWRSARGLGGREPEHDEAGLFREFQDRLKLHPGVGATSPVPPLDRPVDPVAGLVWLVTTAAHGGPWLPTVAEQDAAWWAVFGAASEERRGRHVAALAWSGAPV